VFLLGLLFADRAFDRVDGEEVLVSANQLPRLRIRDECNELERTLTLYSSILYSSYIYCILTFLAMNPRRYQGTLPRLAFSDHFMLAQYAAVA
jgi:hypothetical protein